MGAGRACFRNRAAPAEGDHCSFSKCAKCYVKRFVYSEMYCLECRYGPDVDDDDDSEALNVHDAAQIWASHGKDEDYMLGYS